MSRTGSNHESNRVKPGRTMSQTGSNHELIWVAQSRNMGRAKSQHVSRKAHVMDLLSDFSACISVIQMLLAKSSSIYVFLMCS